jgi:hypothetical protein
VVLALRPFVPAIPLMILPTLAHPKTADLRAAQKKELMLAQLRAELCISDDRHLELRQSVASGEDRPWLK